MLAKQFRLPLRSFPDFFQSASRLEFPSYRIFTHPTALGFARVAVSISKNNVTAVHRNHYKRKIVETVCNNISKIPSSDIVIYVKQNTLPIHLLTAQLEHILGSLHHSAHTTI